MQAVIKHLTKNRMVRFVLSAGAGFLVDILMFYILYHNFFERDTYVFLSYTVGNYTLSLMVSFFMGVMVNFLMTRYIVFTESQLSPYKQFFRFIAIAIIGFFANLFILKLMIQTLHIYAPLARILTALSLFFASYFIHKVFSFNLSLRKNEFRANNK